MRSKETHRFTAFCVSLCMGVSMFSGFAASAEGTDVTEGTTPTAPASTVWKVAADTATAGNSTYVDDDNLTVKSTQDGTKIAATATTIGGVDYTHYLQVRLEADPWGTWTTHKDGATATSLLVSPKTDGTLTVAYRRQSTDNTAAGYAAADGKDLKLSKADAEGVYVKNGYETSTSFNYQVLDEADPKYAYTVQTFDVDANAIYQLWARGTTIQFYGLTFVPDAAVSPTPTATTETETETESPTPTATTETELQSPSPTATTEAELPTPTATTEADVPSVKNLALDKVLFASDLTDLVTPNTESWDVTDTNYVSDYESLGKPFGELADFAAIYTAQVASYPVENMSVEIPNDGEYTINLLFREYSNRGFRVSFDNGTDEPVSADIFSDKKVAKYANYTVTAVSGTASLEAGIYNVTITGIGRDNQAENSGSNLFAMSIISPATTETTAPGTTAPETTAPETTAPETTAPETTAPETTAPETTAPETTAPETTAPETTAPETTAPETAAPAAKNLALDTVLKASDLTDKVAALEGFTWDVTSYADYYTSIGAPFGALADFAATYTQQADLTDVTAIDGMKLTVPTAGDYTVKMLLRHYKERGFNVVFTDSEGKAVTAELICPDDNSIRVAALKPAEGNDVNMTVISQTVTLEAGDYDVSIVPVKGTYLLAMSINSPTTITPGTDAPSTDAPSTDAPSTDAPSTDAPSTDAPSTTVPSTDAPSTDAPSTDAPSTDAPSTDAPSTDAPSTTVPSTDAPSTDAPATDAPSTDAPSTDAPATDAPATEAPVSTDSPEADSVTTTTSSTVITVTNALNGYEYALYDLNGNIVKDWTAADGSTVAFRDLSIGTSYELRFRSESDPSTVYTKSVSTTTGGRTSGGGGGGSTSSYTVTFNTNGGSSVSSVRVNSGSRVFEPTEPTKDGYIFDGWYTDRDLTEEYDFDESVTKSFTLYAKWTSEDGEDPDQTAEPSETSKPSDTMGGTVAQWKNPFADVKTTDWYYDAVKYANENGLFGGTSATEFSPNASVTRGMLVTVLWRSENQPTVNYLMQFTDVAADAYYAEAVRWAASEGIVNGYSDTEFAPDNQITREEMAAIMKRYADYKGVSTDAAGNLSQFSDQANIADWAKDGMAWAVGYGLLSGRDNGTLDPQGSTTRAEAAAILQRFLEK